MHYVNEHSIARQGCVCVCKDVKLMSEVVTEEHPMTKGRQADLAFLRCTVMKH